MGRSVLTRVVALIKKEGYGAQRTIARMSGVAQPMLCQWLRGRCAAALSAPPGFRCAPTLPAWDGVQVRGQFGQDRAHLGPVFGETGRDRRLSACAEEAWPPTERRVSENTSGYREQGRL